jgi:hypothetical protein
MTKFKSKKPHYEYLRKKWVARHKDLSENLFDKHFQKAAAGSIGGLMLLSSTGALLAGGTTPFFQKGSEEVSKEDKNALLKAELLDKVPDEVRVLNPEEEERIAQVLTKDLGIKVSSEIKGIRLNRTYGLIGGEQHLYRYPGDNLYAHSKSAQDWAMFGSSGIAPGLGAWGYFAPSKEEFTPQDEARERWYLATQTFLAPGFAERVREYRDFFKFRKMVVINPKTGQAVVAVIGDAGPASWTGKHLGGSPEVMYDLGLAEGPRKGPVLYFFIDDPEDKVPLGPIKVTNDNQFIRT